MNLPATFTDTVTINKRNTYVQHALGVFALLVTYSVSGTIEKSNLNLHLKVLKFHEEVDVEVVRRRVNRL